MICFQLNSDVDILSVNPINPIPMGQAFISILNTTFLILSIHWITVCN